MSSASIFINYRRSTNAAVAGRLHDVLVNHFGPDEVFLDVDTIRPGTDFVEVLNERVSECKILLAVIGPNWLNLKNKNDEPRLFDPDDYVHIEIKGALERGIPVVPVLVDGAKLPTADELPSELKPLARRQTVELSHDRFVDEVGTLSTSIKKLIGGADPQKLKLHELLFGFGGRIARKEYWKAIFILYSTAIVMGILGAVVLLVIYASDGLSTEDAFEKLEKADDFNNLGVRAIFLMLSIPLFWVYLAIISKRLHDLNFGIKSFILIIIYSVFVFVSYAFGLMSQETFNMHSVFSYSFSFFLGLFEGTKGENDYGPDPLGDRSA